MDFGDLTPSYRPLADIELVFADTNGRPGAEPEENKASEGAKTTRNKGQGCPKTADDAGDGAGYRNPSCSSVQARWLVDLNARTHVLRLLRTPDPVNCWFRIVI